MESMIECSRQVVVIVSHHLLPHSFTNTIFWINFCYIIARFELGCTRWLSATRLTIGCWVCWPVGLFVSQDSYLLGWLTRWLTHRLHRWSFLMTVLGCTVGFELGCPLWPDDCRLDRPDGCPVGWLLSTWLALRTRLPTWFIRWLTLLSNGWLVGLDNFFLF